MPYADPGFFDAPPPGKRQRRPEQPVASTPPPISKPEPVRSAWSLPPDDKLPTAITEARRVYVDALDRLVEKWQVLVHRKVSALDSAVTEHAPDCGERAKAAREKATAEFRSLADQLAACAREISEQAAVEKWAQPPHTYAVGAIRVPPMRSVQTLEAATANLSAALNTPDQPTTTTTRRTDAALRKMQFKGSWAVVDHDAPLHEQVTRGEGNKTVHQGFAVRTRCLDEEQADLFIRRRGGEPVEMAAPEAFQMDALTAANRWPHRSTCERCRSRLNTARSPVAPLLPGRRSPATWPVTTRHGSGRSRRRSSPSASCPIRC